MELTHCVEPDELDAWRALPAGDPRHLHLRECPRCRALVANYALFLAPPEPEPAHLAAADAKLSAFREQMLAAPAHVAERRERAGWRAWFAPALRPAWAFAALTLVAAAFVVMPHLAPMPLRGVLRGERAVALSVTSVRQEAGGLRFTWRGMPAADAYELAFYSTGLVELARMPAGPDTTLEVAATKLPAAWARGDAMLYRVIALQGGDEIGRSPVGTARHE